MAVWLNREELQEAQWEAAKSNLVPCRNCQRRFDPGRIAVHERCCKGAKKPPLGSVRDTCDDEEVTVKGKYQTKLSENSNSNNRKDRRDRSSPASQGSYQGKLSQMFSFVNIINVTGTLLVELQEGHLGCETFCFFKNTLSELGWST